LGADWDTSVFVWAIWTLTVAVALVLAYRGRRFPNVDEWSLISTVTGEKPVTLAWLWAPHVGHRIVLPKLIFLALYNSSAGYDFRAGVLVHVFLLGALAFAMIRAARYLRGWTSYSDAFFPLALLNCGVGIMWNFHLQFICSAVIASIFLLVILRHGNSMAPLNSLRAGLCLVLLPLCGLNGLVLVPALAAWLAYSGIRHRQLSTAKDHLVAAPIMVAFAAVAVLLCLLCLVAYENVTPELASPGLMPTLKTAVAFLSAGLGSTFWGFPTSMALVRLTVLTMLMMTGIVIGASVLRRREERPRAVGLLLFLVALGSLALAVGLGRGGRPWDGLESHYGTLALSILCLMYLAWEIYGSRAASRFVQMCLFALMCGVFALNTSSGLSDAAYFQHEAREVEQDILAGVQPCELAERHIQLFFSAHQDSRWVYTDRAGLRNRVVAGLRSLHRANAGPFRVLRDDQPDAQCKWSPGEDKGLLDDPLP